VLATRLHNRMLFPAQRGWRKDVISTEAQMPHLCNNLLQKRGMTGEHAVDLRLRRFDQCEGSPATRESVTKTQPEILGIPVHGTGSRSSFEGAG
jgi:hypothetical protein